LTLAIFTGSPIVKKEKITSVKQFEITKQIPPNDDNYISTRYQNVIQESSNFQGKKNHSETFENRVVMFSEETGKRSMQLFQS
jgi:hypothetical protein